MRTMLIATICLMLAPFSYLRYMRSLLRPLDPAMAAERPPCHTADMTLERVRNAHPLDARVTITLLVTAAVLSSLRLRGAELDFLVTDWRGWPGNSWTLYRSRPASSVTTIGAAPGSSIPPWRRTPTPRATTTRGQG